MELLLSSLQNTVNENHKFIYNLEENIYILKSTFQIIILLVSFLSLYQCLNFSKKNTISLRFSIFLGSGFYTSFLIKKI